MNLKISLFYYIPFSFELCIYSWGFNNKKCLFLNKKRLFLKKTLRIMNFALFNADIINLESCIFWNNCFNKNSFSIFSENLKLVSAMHSYNTRSARNGLWFVPSYKTSQIWEKINYSFNHAYIELSSRQVNWIYFSVLKTKKSQNAISNTFYFWV